VGAVKFATMKFSALLITLASISRPCSSTRIGSPVEKVVHLLVDLKEKILHDGASEKATYENFACWCTGMTAKKGKAIEDAKDDLKSLGGDIMSLRSKIASLSSDIKDAAADMKTSEEEQEEATKTREDENRAFNALNAEMSSSLAALEMALTSLGESTKKSALLQKAQSVSAQTMQTVRAAIQSVPTRTLGSLSPAKISQLQSFGTAGYNPSYTSIAGILQEMYATLSKDLEKETKTEAQAFKDYEKLMDTKVEEVKALQEKVAKKETEKADAAVELAETTQTYADTERAMKADIDFFDEAVESCEKKEEEWGDRKKLRAEELEGIEKAIEILSSDEARELFAKAIQPGYQGAESFLQIDGMPAGQRKAFQVLKSLASKSQNVALARVASQVRLASGGHFDDVMKAIDKVIGVLKKEQEDDDKKKEQCKDEYQKIAKTSAELEWKIEKNEAKIEKLKITIEKKEKEKAETIEKIDEVKEQIKEMKKVRKQEKEDFEEAKKDDEDAIDTLTKAKDALTAYYKKHKINKALDFMQKEPEFDRGDLAPDAKFSDKGKRGTQTRGIVLLMSNIIGDLKGEINAAVATEKAAVEEYKKALKTAEDLQKDLEEKKENLEKAIADRKKDKDDEEKDKESNEKDLKSEVDYKAEIKDDCDFIIDNFGDRYKKRQVELAGLLQAKDFLAGAMEK
jgi:hypothetical protein